MMQRWQDGNQQNLKFSFSLHKESRKESRGVDKTHRYNRKNAIMRKKTFVLLSPGQICRKNQDKKEGCRKGGEEISTK